jgi:hypothetical protein
MSSERLYISDYHICVTLNKEINNDELKKELLDKGVIPELLVKCETYHIYYYNINKLENDYKNPDYLKSLDEIKRECEYLNQFLALEIIKTGEKILEKDV